MTRSSVRVGFAAACLVLLAGTPGATQTAEHLANVHVVMTEGARSPTRTGRSTSRIWPTIGS